MPAGGGVIQIAAVGRQNAHLNGNADHTLFKTQHRRYTSFAEDLEYNDFSSGTVGFGQKVSASISRYGDLVSDLMLEVAHPLLKPLPQDSSDSPTHRVMYFPLNQPPMPPPHTG